MRLRRGGFSLVELLVATAIAGIVGALMTTTIVRQQRAYTAAGEILDARAQMRDAADILASDIRAAAIASFGLPVMTDTAIEMVTVIGTSVACSAPAGTVIGLPPGRLVTGGTLTSILAQPDTGDIAMLYSIGSSVDQSRWETHRVSAFSTRALGTSCPSTTGFTTESDATAGAVGYQLTLASTPSPNVHKGAPIHFLRRARYSFYRSSDAKWYLGYRRCGSAAPFTCASIQPVSGPYRGYRSGAPPGMTFRYFDSSGAAVTSSSESARVARVEIVVRGEAASAIAPGGDARRTWRDSVVVTVSPRNRNR